MDYNKNYFRIQPSHKQIKEMGKKFKELDINGDTALSKAEFGSIFGNLTEEEKSDLIFGIDQDDNEFITYSEFSNAILNFDIDQDVELSDDELAIVKKKLDQNQKQDDINAQYRILNDITKTEAEKAAASEEIPILKSDRLILSYDISIETQSVRVSGLQTQIDEMQQQIDSGVLGEFEVARLLSQKKDIQAEVDVMLLEKDITVKLFDLENIKKNILEKNREKRQETDPAMIEQLEYEIEVKEFEQISAEQLKNKSERTLELHYNQIKIDHNERQLKKFFIDEPQKDRIRKELEFLRDEKLILQDRHFMNEKVSALTTTRAELLVTKIEDPDNAAKIAELEAQEALEETWSEYAVTQLELHNKQIQLKELLRMSDTNANIKLRTQLGIRIAELETLFQNLKDQLGI